MSERIRKCCPQCSCTRIKKTKEYIKGRAKRITVSIFYKCNDCGHKFLQPGEQLLVSSAHGKPKFIKNKNL